MTLKRIGLLIVLLAGVWAWYNWIWTPRESERINALPQVVEELPASEEESEEVEEPKPTDENKQIKELNLPSPKIEDVSREELKVPKEVVQRAGRFHWLMHLSGPEVEKEAVLHEIGKISRPEIVQLFRELGYQPGRKEQLWDVILVGALEKDGDSWIIGTLAQVDREETMIYMSLKKGEDGKWIIWDLLPNPS